MVFVASIIRNSLCIIDVFLLFFQKSLFIENYFLIAAINLATWGPLYTCLVSSKSHCLKPCLVVLPIYKPIRLIYAIELVAQDTT